MPCWLSCPRASTWVEEQERVILEQGVELNELELQIAARAGVLHPERVRLLAVTKIPLPEENTLAAGSSGSWFVSEITDGLIAGYGFYIRQSRGCDPVLAAHELAHVAQ